MAVPTPHRESDGLIIRKLGPFGPVSNNAFILVDNASNESAIIDAVAEPEQVLAGAADTSVRMVLFTHSHHDHIDSFDVMRERLDVPFYMHPGEPWADHSRIQQHITGGETIRLGETEITTLHTPGHTPGSICYYAAPFLIVGDTLFPGGPGHSTSNENLQMLVASITERIYALPDETMTFNGHGDNCTIAQSKAEYAAFAERKHAADLHGDVLWERD
jgi:glyoxylase-like metal-dependent hydrolase (beta-lactamase superfamily II)